MSGRRGASRVRLCPPEPVVTRQKKHHGVILTHLNNVLSSVPPPVLNSSQQCAKQCGTNGTWYNTMWRKLLYSGFETCFGPSPAPKVPGSDIKTHLKSRFCTILKKRGVVLECEIGCWPVSSSKRPVARPAPVVACPVAYLQ